MKKKLNWLLTIGINLATIAAIAQSHQPSPVIAENFSKLFPGATNVDWKEKTTNYTVFFDLNSSKCEAKFEKGGQWLSTEKTIRLDSLPQSIKNGLKTGKYAEWKQTSAFIVECSDGTTQYHIVVTNTDMTRKILCFGQEGKLLTDR